MNKQIRAVSILHELCRGFPCGATRVIVQALILRCLLFNYAQNWMWAVLGWSTN